MIISPITSVLTDLAENNRSAFSTAYSLDLNSNIDNGVLSTNNFDANTNYAMAALQKVVDIFTYTLDEHYQTLTKQPPMYPNTSSHLIYRAIIEIVGAGDQLNTSNLERIFDQIESLVIDRYLQQNEELESYVDSNQKYSAITTATKVLSLINSILSNSGPNQITSVNAKARMIIVELIVHKFLEEQSEAEIDATLAYANNIDSQLNTFVEHYLNLDGYIDFYSLVNVNFLELDYYSILNVTSIEPLPELAGKQLYLHDELNQMAFWFFFDGESDSGDMTMCFRHEEGDDDNYLNGLETSGFLFEGSWFSIRNKYLHLNFDTLPSNSLTNYLLPDQNRITQFNFIYENLPAHINEYGFIENDSEFSKVKPENSADCVAILNE